MPEAKKRRKVVLEVRSTIPYLDRFPTRADFLRSCETHYLQTVMFRNDHCVTEAAKEARVNRPHFYAMLRRAGVMTKKELRHQRGQLKQPDDMLSKWLLQRPHVADRNQGNP